jgi:hypothetical protein
VALVNQILPESPGQKAVEFTGFLRDHPASLRELYYTTTDSRQQATSVEGALYQAT